MRSDCEQARAAWPVFLRSCVMLMDRLDRQLQARVGLPLSWYEVLQELDSAPGGRLTMRQLADSVMLSKSGVTRLVDRMAEAGLIQRLACADDGRVCFAVLTSRGRGVLKQAKPIASEGVEQYFAQHISDDEARVMADALTRVLSSAGAPYRESRPGRPAAAVPHSPIRA